MRPSRWATTSRFEWLREPQAHGALGLLYATNVRIAYFGVCMQMETRVAPARKRRVNLTMKKALVAQAKSYTNNLSATMESLLAEFVRTVA